MKELARGRYVRLREMTREDGPDVVEWRNRPETARWLIQWKPLTLDEHLRWWREGRERGEMLVIFERPDGTKVGATSVLDFDVLGSSAEWGRLSAARQGGDKLGILEGCYLIQRICFEALEMQRLHGAVAADNERAFRIYRLLGWRSEGIRPRHWVHPGGYFDVRMVGCLREQFEDARKDIEQKLYGDDPPPELEPEQRERLRRRFGRGFDFPRP